MCLPLSHNGIIIIIIIIKYYISLSNITRKKKSFCHVTNYQPIKWFHIHTSLALAFYSASKPNSWRSSISFIKEINLFVSSIWPNMNFHHNSVYTIWTLVVANVICIKLYIPSLMFLGFINFSVIVDYIFLGYMQIEHLQG